MAGGAASTCGRAEGLRAALAASGLFDAGWYAAQYPDVARSGLPPLEHFLLAGMLMGRDPGPGFSEAFMRAAVPRLNLPGKSALRIWLEDGPCEVPRERVLPAAKALADTGRAGDAMRMARRYLGAGAERPLRLFAANEALSRGDRQGWLSCVNDYLAPFGVAPLRLRGGENLLRQLHTDPVPKTGGGPLVSVIMPAFEAEATIEAAAASILEQSWANLELLIVDDASGDGTWAAMRRIAASDSRVRIRRNARNVGPYVSKNLALAQAGGRFVTGHDADDWAHPQRIERHMARVLESQGAIRAGTGMMFRLDPVGRVENIIPSSPDHSPDGIRRRAFISCLFEREALDRELGFFDCVRFGGDGEMLYRARKVLGSAWRDFDLLTMICMDFPGSLTNHPEHGLKTAAGISETRRRYAAAYEKWHDEAAPAELRMAFPSPRRPFPAPPEIIVPAADMAALRAV